MIKITHVINDLAVGGAEAMLIKLIGAADRDQVRHSVVTLMGGGPLAPGLRATGIDVVALGMGRNFPNPAIVCRLVRALRRLRPDVIQSWLYQSDFAATLAAPFVGAPLIWNIRSSNLDMSHSRPLSRLLPRTLARLSRVPAAVMLNSAAAVQFHQALGYRPRRWHVVPNGFDVARFRPDAAARAALRHELGIAADAPVIAMPARFHAMKDHASFIAAVAASRQPDIVFLLAGPGVGADNAELAAMIEAAGVSRQVRLLGNRDDMPRLYAASDLVSLSSAFGEGFPNVVGEAMACGVPCVATDVGDCAAIIGDCGRVVPPRNPEALAMAWRDVLGLSPEARAALGRAARARICERYTLPAIVRAYDEIYAAVAAGKR